MTENSHQAEEYLKWLTYLENGEDEELIDQFLDGSLQQEDLVRNAKGERPVLKPGGPGLLGCLKRIDGVKGHFDATAEVLTEYGILNNKAILSIARASRLPDILHFNDLRYHAQSYTVSDSDHRVRDSAADKQAFQQLLHAEISAGLVEIKNDCVKPFYFHLGTVLHMVQDLACHQGMTNPEHTYLDGKKDRKGKSYSPDLSEKRFELSKLATKFVVDHIYLEDIKLKLDLINATELIKWSQYEKVKDLIKLIKDGIKFKLNTIDVFKPEYSSRWFQYDELGDAKANLEYLKPFIDTLSFSGLSD